MPESDRAQADVGVDSSIAPPLRRSPYKTAAVTDSRRRAGCVVARYAGKVYAFSLSCPHQNTALRWNADDKEFTCPKHKSHYKPDGQFIDGRATRDMDRLEIKRDGANIVVEVDVLYQEDLNKAQWTAAFVPV